jgi:hypothetical protein
LSSITIKGMPLLIQSVVLGVDDWFLNLQFFLWTPLYVGMTPLITTTCGIMKITMKSHMYVTCRILDLDAM